MVYPWLMESHTPGGETDPISLQGWEARVTSPKGSLEWAENGTMERLRIDLAGGPFWLAENLPG